MIEQKLQQLSTEEKIKLIRKIYADDIDKFFQNCVVTLDEHDKSGNPYKKIPYHWAYIPELVHTFLQNPWVLVWKSRQILATWTAMAYALWICMFHEGKKVAIQSKKSDDADALIQRIKVIWDKLPAWKPKAEFSYCRVKFPELGSDIYGIPQGPEQARSYTFSCFISDEYGFQEKTQETFSAVKPIVDGGGQFIAITTPPREKNFSYVCKKTQMDSLKYSRFITPDDQIEMKSGKLTLKKVGRLMIGIEKMNSRWCSLELLVCSVILAIVYTLMLALSTIVI